MNRYRRIGFPVVATARGQSHNVGMNSWLALSLAFLWAGVGTTAVVAGAIEPTVTLHRCTDARGVVTWQDDPCPKGSEEVVREMIRPVDPPKSSRKPAPPVAVAAPPAPPARRRELIPPPPMYKCTTYDGNERFSESYDPNPRCEPIVVYYPYPNYINPTQGLSCRWVEDSCVRLPDRAACERWRVRQKDAYSELQRSFSDTAAYRKSELERINQIIDESCS